VPSLRLDRPGQNLLDQSRAKIDTVLLFHEHANTDASGTLHQQARRLHSDRHSPDIPLQNIELTDQGAQSGQAIPLLCGCGSLRLLLFSPLYIESDSPKRECSNRCHV